MHEFSDEHRGMNGAMRKSEISRSWTGVIANRQKRVREVPGRKYSNNQPEPYDGTTWN